MTEDEKDILITSLERLIRDVATTGGYRYSGDCGEYTLTPFRKSPCTEIETVIYHLVNALGNLESIKPED